MEQIDAAFVKFKALLPELVAALTGVQTEADTRLQVIDRMLIEVLGWDHADIKCEKRSGDGFADYVLSNLGKSRVVVEAKRDGRELGCRTRAAGQSYRLNGPTFKTESAKEGIKQGILYCAMNSAELACVTNGLEWIIFRGSRLGDGTDVQAGMSFVFPGLVEIESKFEMFYSLLAKRSVTGYSYRPYFQEAEGQPIRTSVYSRTLRKAGSARVKSPGQLSKDLDRTMSEFFARLSGEGDDDMIRACFVESAESKIADHRLAKVANDLVSQIQPLETSRGSALTDVITRNQVSHRKEFVLLVGTKGSGKSTFIDRFFKLVLPRNIAEHCVIIRVDMKENPGDAQSVVTWLNKRLVSASEDVIFPDTPEFSEIQGMFFDEYKRLSKGPLKALYDRDKESFHEEFGRRMDQLRSDDAHAYLQGILRHVRNQRSSLPIIVLDNADHFDINFQQSVYQYARSLYEQSACLIIMPITDRTSWQLSKHGALQSFEVTSLFLPTPQIGDVIRKRIDFIDSKMEIEGKNPQSGYFVKRGISLSLKDLNGFARAMQRVFLDTPNVSKTVGELANFDIRRTLDLVRRTISSPHIQVDDLVTSFILGNAVRVPPWRVDRAIIRQGYEVYPSGQHDFVQNGFDLDSSLTTSPLLGIRILTLLRDVPDKEHEGPTIDVDSVRAYLGGMDFQPRAVDLWLDAMLKTGLVLNFDPTVQDIANCTVLELSASGRRHLSWALGNFEYLGAMAEVTPILTENVFEILREFRYNEWRQTTATFIDYLLAEDRYYCVIPDHDTYAGQARIQKVLADIGLRLRDQVESRTSQRR